MADFYEVHRKGLEAAERRIRVGECWNVTLREPLGAVSATVPVTETITMVSFTASRDGRLKPSTEGDCAAIVEWTNRHRHTSADAFDWRPF